MTQQNLETSPAMQKAIELLKEGKTVQAEEVVLEAAKAAEQKFGPDKPETASAYNDLGTILINVGNLQGGVEAYRRACSGPMPNTEELLKDRLTFLMNLGMALQFSEQLDEAENVFREGLKRRLEFYGREHAGYAFGLEPLASLLLRLGKVDEALAAYDETIEIFWNNGHPRVITALALRAEAFKVVKSNRPSFDEVEQLPDELVEEMVFFI
ncbi:MAG: tetratricopeptide repeat protein, partial [Cyanobacteria bacterium]|nr:tetratricopeptide repeat protein [Cyanobacteriota bacterium]